MSPSVQGCALVAAEVVSVGARARCCPPAATCSACERRSARVQERILLPFHRAQPWRSRTPCAEGSARVRESLNSRLIVAMEDVLASLAPTTQGSWDVHDELSIFRPRCLAVDRAAGRLYCGTAASGVWRSRDGGSTWERTSAPIGQVTALAVAPSDRSLGVVYAGTEPSAVLRSRDGGDSWDTRGDLTRVPSSPTWRFPPRPETHHVRWIWPDPTVAGLYVAIEAGALIRSDDSRAGGQWHARHRHQAGATARGWTALRHRSAGRHRERQARAFTSGVTVDEVIESR